MTLHEIIQTTTTRGPTGHMSIEDHRHLLHVGRPIYMHTSLASPCPWNKNFIQMEHCIKKALCYLKNNINNEAHRP